MEVQNTFQPPSAGGFRLIRRRAQVGSSMTCSSTSIPSLRMRSAATVVSIFARQSPAGAMTTTFSPR